MDDGALGLWLLLLSWLVYGALHSWLASLRLKQALSRRWPAFGPAYRLVYNVLAALLLIPPVWLMEALDGPYLWRWMGPWRWVSGLASFIALVGFAWSLKYYDGLEFLGWRQWRRRADPSQDLGPFILSPLHRFVRHPWYFLGLLLVWTRDMTAPRLLTVVTVTLYLVIGSRLEENKLAQFHGEVYRRYRARVPALFPLPWHYLTRAEAETLVHDGRRSRLEARPAGSGRV
jgi:protein-S-isoprenylcysteine O-methyltransferase Ste14